MTAMLLTATNEDARRDANTTSAPTMPEGTSQTQHSDHTTEAAMITTPLLLLPAVCLTEPGPRPEKRSAMRVVYDRRRELRKAITERGGAVCAKCDGHGWGHPADNGEVWPCWHCVDGIRPLEVATPVAPRYAAGQRVNTPFTSGTVVRYEQWAKNLVVAVRLDGNSGETFFRWDDPAVTPAPVAPETVAAVEDTQSEIVVDPVRQHIVVDWLPEHDWLIPVGPERGFKDDCPVCQGHGELADLRDPANPERVDCSVCDGTGARRGTTLYQTRSRLRAQAAAAERMTIEF